MGGTTDTLAAGEAVMVSVLCCWGVACGWSLCLRSLELESVVVVLAGVAVAPSEDVFCFSSLSFFFCAFTSTSD